MLQTLLSTFSTIFMDITLLVHGTPKRVRTLQYILADFKGLVEVKAVRY